MNIGKSLRIAMVNRQLNQKEVAKKIGVTNVYVSYICSGKCKISQTLLERMAKELGYSVSEFIKLGE